MTQMTRKLDAERGSEQSPQPSLVCSYRRTCRGRGDRPQAEREENLVHHIRQALPDHLQGLDGDQRYVLLLRRRTLILRSANALSITSSASTRVMTGAAYCGCPNID